MPKIYDAITPSNLPTGADAYLGYADGRYKNVAQIQARFPGKPVYALSVVGTKGVGGGVDSEPGDASTATAASYIQAEIAAGVDRPILYTMESWAQAAVQAMAAANVPRTSWRLLTAHYSQGAHICGPSTCGCPVQADGTQWIDHGDVYDESLVSDDFISAASHPTAGGSAPAPTAPVPAPTKDEKVYSIFEFDAVTNGSQFLTDWQTFRWITDTGDLAAIKAALNPTELGVVGSVSAYGVPTDSVTAAKAGVRWPL